MVSFFLSPQPSLLAPEKPVPGVQIEETAQRKASRKKALGQRERGKKPSSLSLPFFRFFSSALFCTTIHCLNSWNRLAPEVTQRSTEKRKQRAVEIPQADQNI